jgi:hypothetical protein
VGGRYSASPVRENRSRLSTLAFLGAALSCLLTAPLVRADAPFRLEWTAPPGCPDVRAVRARIESLVTGAPETRLDAPLSVSAVVETTPRGAVLRMRTDHGGIPGERRLEGATCEEVTSAGALVVALAIDPEAREGRVPEEPPMAAFDPPEDPGDPAAGPEPPRAPLDPPPAPAAEPSEEGTGDAPASPAFALGLGAGFDTSALPQGAFGAVATGWYRTDRWRFGADAGYFPPRRGEAEGYPGKGGDIALAALGVVGCWTPIGTLFILGACAHAEAGALLYDGQGIENRRSAAATWLAVGASASLWLRPGGPLGLGLRAGPAFPIGRPRFVFTAEDGEQVEVHRPPPVGVRVLLGADWEFR